MDMKRIGAFLQTLRKEKGWTQEQLGEKLSVSGKTVSRWETGAYMPPVDALQALAALYGLTIDELLSAQRLNPEAVPACTVDPRSACLRKPERFQSAEQKSYWRRKWLREHTALLVCGGLLFLSVQLAGFLLDQPLINGAGSILAVAAAAFLRNRLEGYVEHHLYDE